MSQSASLPSQPSANLDMCHSASSQIPHQNHSLDSTISRPRNEESILYHPTDEIENLNTIIADHDQHASKEVESVDQPLSIPQQESSGSFVVVSHQDMNSFETKLQTDADAPLPHTDANGDVNRCSTALETLGNPPCLRHQSSQLTCSESINQTEHQGLRQGKNYPDGGGTTFYSEEQPSSTDSSIEILDYQAEGNVVIQGVDATRNINIPGLSEGIQINITNAAKTIQVGSNNVMHVQKGAAVRNSQQDSSTNSNQKKVVDIKVPKRIITGGDLDIIATHLGKDWKRLGMKIGFVAGELDAFQHDFAMNGLREIIFQMMLAWRERLGPDAMLKVIVKELLAIKRPDVAKLFHAEPNVELYTE